MSVPRFQIDDNQAMMQHNLAPAPHPANQQDNMTEQKMREQLLAQVQPPQVEGSMALEVMHAPASAGPHDQNIDPAIAGPVMPMTPGAVDPTAGDDSHTDSTPSKRINKRELSSSKRAAQNRAAQRAFRLRKESYIKKLEGEVRELEGLDRGYKAIQAENYQLRDYIINLQSRLIESQGEFPQPPSNIDLHNPRPEAMEVQMTGPAVTVPTAPMGPGTVATTEAAPNADNRLQASAAQAQAVAAAAADDAKQGATAEDDAAAAAAQLVGNVFSAEPADSKRDTVGNVDVKASNGVGGPSKGATAPIG